MTVKRVQPGFRLTTRAFDLCLSTHGWEWRFAVERWPHHARLMLGPIRIWVQW